MPSFVERLTSWLAGNPPASVPVLDEPSFQLKELPDGRLRYLCISTNNYEDFSGEYFPAAAHKEAIAWAEQQNAYPELWPWHMYGQRLGVADWMDFDGNFLLSSGLIDVGMEQKARAWAEDPDTAMSHGFFHHKTGPDIVKYRQFEQSVLPRWAAANPFTDFTVGTGVKEMALTPEKRAALAVKGYTPEELSALDAKTDEFRQRLAAMGISMKDVEEPAPTPPAPPAPAPAPTPTPEAVPAVNTAPAAPVAASAPAPFTLDDLRSVIREEVGAATKELSTKVATIEAEAKQTDDERFAAMWKERAANPGAPASRSTETVVQGGSKEAVAAGQGNAWVGNIPLFQWLGTDGMQGQGVGGQN